MCDIHCQSVACQWGLKRSAPARRAKPVISNLLWLRVVCRCHPLLVHSQVGSQIQETPALFFFLLFFKLHALLRFVVSVMPEQFYWTLLFGHISHFPVWAGDEGPAWGDSQLLGRFSPPALLIFLPVVSGPFCLFTLIKDPLPALLLNKSFFGSFNHCCGSSVICSLSRASCSFLSIGRNGEFKHFSQCVFLRFVHCEFTPWEKIWTTEIIIKKKKTEQWTSTVSLPPDSQQKLDLIWIFRQDSRKWQIKLMRGKSKTNFEVEQKKYYES